MGLPSTIVFDVNETLFDIESIGPFFEGTIKTFFTFGQGVLEMLGIICGVPIQPADLEELRSSMLSMPAHKDVPEGLLILKEAGFRLMTLTNSPPSDGGTPLERAGLDHFIERQFSVDSALQV